MEINMPSSLQTSVYAIHANNVNDIWTDIIDDDSQNRALTCYIVARSLPFTAPKLRPDPAAACAGLAAQQSRQARAALRAERRQRQRRRLQGVAARLGQQWQRRRRRSGQHSGWFVGHRSGALHTRETAEDHHGSAVQQLRLFSHRESYMWRI